MRERSRQLFDLLGQLGIVGYFTFAATVQCFRVSSAFEKWQAQGETHSILGMFSELAVLVFLALVIITTLFRHRSSAHAKGLEPRISALAGTFLLGLLALLPKAGLQPPAITLVGLLLILAGSLMSAYVLAWLGRSFSITAQARRLVTAGPYAIVRHPLYVAEEVTAVGIVILHFSWPAVVLGIIQWAFQLRRMHNEERVLRSTFQEYDGYARFTPRVLPRSLPRSRRRLV